MSTHKTIAKNTIFLYMRMFLIMGITLYTSRIVLKELGISDYGVYNLVAGIVSMMGFLNVAMSAVTQRYLSHDIGRGDLVQLKKTFSATLTIHVGIAIVGFVIAETLGLWYINNIMIFPLEQSYAVNVVYQFSILTFLLNIIQVPYNALIIAHERMKVYAYMSILEASLKLGIVFVLFIVDSNKLIVYSILTFVVSLFIRICYQFYCRTQFSESKFKFYYNRVYYKELIGYSGWTLIGASSLIAKNQGMNLILNLFFGTLINASYSIALQVQNSIQLFVSNFQSALNPQIIKNHASKNIVKSRELIFLGSKFSALIMLVLIFPIFYNVEFIMMFWLNTLPVNIIAFVKLSMVMILIDSVSGPLMTGVLATGKIKNYNIIIGGVNMLSLPISYYLLDIGFDSSVIFYILILFSVVSLILRLFIIKKEFSFNLKEFFSRVLMRVLLVCLSVFCVEKGIVFILKSESIIKLIVLFLISAMLAFFIGFNRSEKDKIVGLMKSKL